MSVTIILLFLSNLFMTFAWYGHLKNFKTSPLWIAITVSWGIAFFEYCLQVPANRFGSKHFSLAQLKIIQEVITMLVFAGFATLYMKESISAKNLIGASVCLVGAVYFIFKR